MRFVSIVIMIVAMTTYTVRSEAFPLVTISCDQPAGVSMAYGASFSELLDADQSKQPEPKPTLKEARKDSFLGKPTFVIDSNKRDMTVVWGELPADVELRKRATEENLPTIPPPPATNATIVLFSFEQISAIEAQLWSISTYSFFPRFGTSFIAQQAMSMGLKNTTQIATFAHCVFSWSNPNDDPVRKNKP